MTESKKRSGEATREAILNAAETVFAKHGYDGAYISIIAEASGYNKTLIFRYFGDKLGLYAAVLKRIDSEWSKILARMFMSLFADDSIMTDGQRFREFLRTTFEFCFDYMVDHPNFTRILNWEQAEGWHTFTNIASQFEPDDLAQFESIFSKAQKAGLLRADMDIIVMILQVQQLCWSTAANLVLFQLLLSGKKLTHDESLRYLRNQIMELLINGIMIDPKEKKT